MQKNDLISAVAQETGATKKDVNEIMNSVFNQIAEALARGEEVHIRNFGSFEVKTKNARVARNPKTGEQIQAAESKGVRFRAHLSLKDKVN